MKKQKNHIQEIIEWSLCIVSSMIIAVVIQSQVFAMSEITQSSMENTLIKGQKVILDKISYVNHEPKRGFKQLLYN